MAVNGRVTFQQRVLSDLGRIMVKLDKHERTLEVVLQLLDRIEQELLAPSRHADGAGSP